MSTQNANESLRDSQSPLFQLSDYLARRVAIRAIGLGLVMALIPPLSHGSQPGRGITAGFEVRLIQLIIDHHYSALRMTELAAGTDPQRTGNLTPDEGTSPTPGYPVTRPKSSLDEVKSMARMENRSQREEIAHLRVLLRQWYGIDYEPRVRQEQQQMLAFLDNAQPGRQFDHVFLEVFSRHHYTLLQPLNACITGADRRHDELIRLCTQMWHVQTAAVDEMRQLLERHFHIADYQPFSVDRPLHGQAGSPRGQHSGGD
ncbi:MULTISPECIES: DUF305 domain-containing protein [Cupriavidus]|uniref:Lipoprotein n=2 Tax=Cupriavidus TaxID=106589 RepID=A0A375CJW9_9BURK|nr:MULTISPECIES: DUF305 domain-containing protein [Cupriavidus]MCA7082511.1 DUF305 domain-containing protein [Cupriavidus sp. DB3]UDM48985.1 DUF305 domain-containing protein [Cupriavidus sp. MP-37]SOY73064.1 putative lipoprotein [Cupriavidus taiwanensis]